MDDGYGWFTIEALLLSEMSATAKVVAPAHNSHLQLLAMVCSSVYVVLLSYMASTYGGVPAAHCALCGVSVVGATGGGGTCGARIRRGIGHGIGPH